MFFMTEALILFVVKEKKQKTGFYVCSCLYLRYVRKKESQRFNQEGGRGISSTLKQASALLFYFKLLICFAIRQPCLDNVNRRVQSE